MGRGLSGIQKVLLLQIHSWLELRGDKTDEEYAMVEIASCGRLRTKLINIEGESIPVFLWRNRESIYKNPVSWGTFHKLPSELGATSKSLKRLGSRELVIRYFDDVGPRKRQTTKYVVLTPEGRKIAKALKENGHPSHLI